MTNNQKVPTFDFETKKVEKLMLAENKDEMRERILEAALKRFTHYSASKTTMNEIADDLHCSKASLYYYFADKKCLHIAVLEKIGEMFFGELENIAAHSPSAEAALKKIIEVSGEFIKRFCRLEIFKVLNDHNSAKEMAEKLQEVKQREIGIFTTIIQKGIDAGEFMVKDAREIATLYNNLLTGLRFSVPGNPHQDVDMDLEMQDMITGQQQMMTEIFIRGIKHRQG